MRKVKQSRLKKILTIVGWLLFMSQTQAQVTSYTQRNAFNTATTNTTETLNFDSQVSNTIIPSGSSLTVGATIGAATFMYSAGNVPNGPLRTTSDFFTSSNYNYLAATSRLDYGDTFTLTFAQPVRAIGMYFLISSNTSVLSNAWTLTVANGSAISSTTVNAGSNVPFAKVYFVGIQDNAGFSSVTITGSAASSLEFFIDDIVVEQYAVATTPELDVRNNADDTDITDASTTISTTLGTDFGSNCVTGGTASMTFRAENNGTGVLTLGTDALAISNTTDFSIATDLTNSGTIAASAFAAFTIQFNPTSSGTKTCMVTLRSDDADEDPYIFNIQGVGLHPMVTLAATTNSVAEDGVSNLVYQFSRDCTSGTLAINFSIASSSTAVTGDYAVSTGGTGLVTFSGSSGTITFSTGAATVDLTINPTTDTTVEMDETVVVKIDP
ncbi:MAG: hypothetical protein ACPGXL_01510 [Chitinophagales bacterium]